MMHVEVHSPAWKGVASAPRLSIVVPTLNEEDNVGELLERIEASLPDVPHETIVVDDDSNDGTRAVALDRGTNLRLVHRTDERGLSSAVLEGFRRARGEYVCVIDGDLQHPPEAIEDLLSAAMWSDADLVVGSRYAPGGAVDQFPVPRRAISAVSRGLARFALPLVRDHDLQDPTAGFFLVRRDRLNLAAIEPRGYKILLEILHSCPIEDVREVGISFQGRPNGHSNATVATGRRFLGQLAALAVDAAPNRRFGKFALVGAFGVLVNLALLGGLTELAGLHYFVSAVIAIETSILSNFALNDSWTFRDRRTGRWWHRLARFNTVSLGALLLNLAVLTALTEGLHLHYLLAEIVAIGVSFLANYEGNLTWTYITSSPSEIEEPGRLPWML